MSELASPRNRTPSNLRRNDGGRAVLEQAKGALMMRYGIGSHEAFALLLTWSRESNTTLHTIAHTLVNNVRQGDGAHHHDAALAHWLQEQLSEHTTGHP